MAKTPPRARAASAICRSAGRTGVSGGVASETRSPTPTVCALRASSGTWYARPAGVSTTA